MSRESPGKEQGNTKGKSHFGMVATASGVATDAGVRMLDLGGNAVDAAVAAAFCLGVTEPQASGLGGQSMALLYFADTRESIAVDGSSRAPFAIDPMHPPEKPRKLGLKSSTLPSTPATLGYMLERYGKLKLPQVLEPAIKAAKEGFKVTSLQHRFLKRESSELLKDPLIAERFFKNGKPHPSGDLLVQPGLATCLEKMAEEGWKAFY